MILQELLTFFSQNCEEDGTPRVQDIIWHELIKKFDKQDIKDSLAEYVHRHSIEFPWRNHSYDKFKTRFLNFCSKSMLNEYKQFDVVHERYDYKYKYEDSPLGVIDKSHTYNVVSDYFQQKNRLKCGTTAELSPYQIWSDKEALSKMNWTFWRMSKSGPKRETFLSSFRLGTYTATQFRPSVAKALYEKHNAINVLDTSCGWGDRLAGFYATPSTKLYVGCDPNPEVFEVYKQQCLEYEKLLGSTPELIECENYFECFGKKTVKIWRKPSEDVNWDFYKDTFDLYFTSPPYFETEKYAENSEKESEQSWSRYSTFDSWKYDFFFETTRKVWSTIKEHGFMMINIIEPRSSKKERYKLCDDMVEYFQSFEDSNYVGKIGMRMMARPNAKELHEVFVEPIWTFRKGNSDYIQSENNTLEDFFN